MDTLEKLLGLLKEANDLVTTSVAAPPPKPSTDAPTPKAVGGEKGGARKSAAQGVQDLGSSEGAMRLVGAELQRLVGTYADKTGIQLGTPQVFQRRLMTEWEDLAVGGSTESIIWVIDVARELERLCKRPAPGAGEKVGWQKSMAALAGKTYRITCHFDHWRAFQIFDIDVNGEDAPEDEDEMTEMGFNVPFDACALVWRGGEPFPVAQRVP